jgi:DNA polymerase III subunit alpha
MEYNVYPFFKSHYSLGRSILTLGSQESENHPDSIFEIAKENNLKEIFLVEDNMSGFLEAYLNSQEHDIKLNFGLRLTVCSDSSEKNEEGRSSESKIILFIKNKKGYEDIIKAFTYASTDGFYYYPRTDYKALKEIGFKNLSMVVPFYDSFLYENNFRNKACVPNFISLYKNETGACPIFCIEDNDLPFDRNLTKLVEKYSTSNGCETIKTKSIYYKNKSDYFSYLTFRCIHNRSTLDKPNFGHMCSNEFSFESWKGVN